MPRLTLAAVAALAAFPALAADRERAPAPKPWIDLTGYKVPSELIKADAKAFKEAPAGVPTLPGYLGVDIADGPNGLPVVADVDDNSPAAGTLAVGDVLVKIAGIDTPTAAAAREALRGRAANDQLPLNFRRGSDLKAAVVALKAVSKPFSGTAQRIVLGVTLDPARAAGGLPVVAVASGGSAEKAGLKAGDILLKVNGAVLEGDSGLRDAIAEKPAGEVVTLFVERDKKPLELKATLAAESLTGRAGSGWDDRLPSTFRKPKYNLGIIGVEYPDTKHDEKISGKDWETALFSTGTYTEKSVTGQKVYGSMNDYYRELSYGQLKVEGKFLGWFEASKKKMDYNLGSSVSASDKSKYFTEVMDKVFSKLGKDGVKDYDGLFFVFAGERVQTSRGGLYWPHRSNFTHDKKRYSYFIVPERSRSGMTDISVICHEFGHMLGLPDLYAKPENPGSEGVGVWCAMSQQNGEGRPQHFSAYCKEQMGWLKPVVIDPRVKQKVILPPVEDGYDGAVKIPVRADLSEYFLLENRQRKGFDKALPADGLLVWRVMPGNRGSQPVYLEEAHGVEGSTGPRMFPGAVPFPSPANSAFTPFTTPSSKSQLGGGLDVHITNVRRLPDGRVTLHVGYKFQ